MGQPGTMVENWENIGETYRNMVERQKHIRGVRPENGELKQDFGESLKIQPNMTG